MLESLFEKRLQHRCFPVNIAKFLRTPIFTNICERLLSHVFCTQLHIQIKVFSLIRSSIITFFTIW